MLVTALAFIAGGVAWKIHTWAPPPDEKHLREVFAAKRALFEQLVHMGSEDANGTVTVGNGILYSERVPQERVQQYRNIASALDPKLKLGTACGRAQTFVFEEDTFLLAIGSHYANGIDYIPAVDERFVVIVKSIDEAKARKLPEYWVPMSDHWYLFHTED